MYITPIMRIKIFTYVKNIQWLIPTQKRNVFFSLNIYTQTQPTSYEYLSEKKYLTKYNKFK